MSQEFDIFADLDSFCSSKHVPAVNTTISDETIPEDFPKDEEIIPLPATKQNVKLVTNKRSPRRAKKTTQDVITEILEKPVKKAAAAKKTKATPPRKNSRGRNKKINNIFIVNPSAQNVIDTIDLITSPTIPVTGKINLTSDNEEEEEDRPEHKTLDNSFELENAEMSIKINWEGKIEIFKMRKYQKFREIFKTIAERENADLGSLIFNVESKIVGPDDSPASIDYKIFQFICGRVIETENMEFGKEIYRKKDKNQISLKVQSDRWKRPFAIQMSRTDPFRILYIKCSEELNMTCNDFKLHFDGEVLEPTETPNEIQLDGGEIIDCVFRK